MILYHFSTSPFARRVRLVLAHKGLSAELRDARANPAHMEELKKLHPLHTVPVLVDGERVVRDSTAIVHHLERTHPSPAILPEGVAGAEAFELAALCDSIVTVLADLGMRYHAFHDHPTFQAVRTVFVGRVQRALDTLAERVSRHAPGEPLIGDRWSFADIVVYTTVAWLEALPVRAQTFAPSRQVVELGWTLPDALKRWAEPLRNRRDVAALG